MTRDRIEAALEGDLRAFMEDELRISEQAVTKGLRAAGDRLKRRLRQDVVSAGLGRRLSKNWQSRTYPKNGASLGAATTVSAKAPQLMRAFEEGSKIRATGGRFLAIPTPAAPKQGVGRKRLTPETFPEHRFGPLRFVPRRNGLALLVVDNQRERKGKRGGYALSRSKRARKTGYGLLSVPMFVLVPQVRLKPRLNIEQITREAVAGLASDIDAAFRTMPDRRR
ncbi:DUF6441 family protein [Salipiger mucosus]|uniref:Uncharacterized protein n=1 Tax=Salipiger mucosus DSM 16094 TaxID=1123237 RepID=S9QR67_9RHOB|nr:DUF6441 family protein [Salipiger mucosus]EPX82098.1 hypothetical protein Salmuc_02466 [Salipiger mucosus DSM 16094]